MNPADPCAEPSALPRLAERARAALAAVADDLAPLLQDELARMAAGRRAWRAGAPNDLDVATHDLKGLGSIFGAPVAARIAASLERLLDEDPAAAALVDLHVDAIIAVVREGAATGRDPRGVELAAALEAAVAGRLSARWPQAA